MKKTSIAAIGIIAVFACLLCLLLCTPALANNNLTDLNVTEITVNYDASSLGDTGVDSKTRSGVHNHEKRLSEVIEEKHGVEGG